MADADSKRGKDELDDPREKTATQIHLIVLQVSAVVVVLIPTVTQLSATLPQNTKLAFYSAMFPFIEAAIISTLRLYDVMRNPVVSVITPYPLLSLMAGWFSLVAVIGILTAGVSSLGVYYFIIGSVSSIFGLVFLSWDLALRARQKRTVKAVSTEKSQVGNQRQST